MPRANLLLVDDDSALLSVLSMALEDAGFSVRTAENGKMGWESFQKAAPDVVVLDILMPELDGLDVCRRIRATSRVPVVLLTSRESELDKVLGLELGADDYVTKPFSTRELVARLRAVLRRVEMDKNPGAEAPPRVRTLGPLSLDRGRREIRAGETLVVLTATEFDLLWTLMGEPGRVFRRDELLSATYGPGVVVEDRTVDTFVKRIRSKLAEALPGCAVIETVRGVGYRLRS